MNNKFVIFIVGLVAGVLVSFLAIITFLPQRIFIEYESKLGFDETVEEIKTLVVENNWALPHEYNLQATMEKNGYEVEPVKVFSICNPEHAYQILSGKDERKVTALMPCRISVYEKEGKTYISMLNAGLLSKLMGEKVKNVMGIVSEENKLILKPVIKN